VKALDELTSPMKMTEEEELSDEQKVDIEPIETPEEGEETEVDIHIHVNICDVHNQYMYV
jgi:hypothetical protein